MALCFLIYCYKFIKNSKIQPIFYLVDHGLRKGSNRSSKLVKKHFKKKINLKILKWKGKKPNSNLQSLARQKRYSFYLMNVKKKY